MEEASEFHDRAGKRAEFLPFSRPTIAEEEVAEVVDSLRSGWITTGPKVARFESMFCARLGVEQAVAVSSATAGLHLAVAALGLQPGDEVIVPSLTWASTANVVELAGARVVFADVDESTLCLDPADAARRVTAKTRALIPVHFAGQPADLDALRSLARAHGLTIIQDAAHALGASYRGEEIGASGESTVFSFHPIKNITTGEGGMIVTNDAVLAERCRLLRFHGVTKDAWKRYQGAQRPTYDVLEPGWKYNMMDLQAALGIHQLAKLDQFIARRRALAARYDDLLAEVPGIVPLGRVRYPARHAWHLYVVRLDSDRLAIDRDDFVLALAAENIGAAVHFPPLHLASYYRRKYAYAGGDLPAATAAGARILSLPLYPLLAEDDQDDVICALRRLVRRHRRPA